MQNVFEIDDVIYKDVVIIGKYTEVSWTPLI